MVCLAYCLSVAVDAWCFYGCHEIVYCLVLREAFNKTTLSQEITNIWDRNTPRRSRMRSALLRKAATKSNTGRGRLSRWNTSRGGFSYLGGGVWAPSLDAVMPNSSAWFASAPAAKADGGQMVEERTGRCMAHHVWMRASAWLNKTTWSPWQTG